MICSVLSLCIVTFHSRVLYVTILLSTVNKFIRSFVRPFVRSFVRSFVHSFIRSFVHSFIHMIKPLNICHSGKLHYYIITVNLSCSS